MPTHKFWIPALVLCLFSITAVGQASDEVHYYKYRGGDHEVSPSKAKYAKRVRQNADHSVTTEWILLRTNAVIESESYLDGTPVGLWIISDRRGTIMKQLDYRFGLKYTTDSCNSDYHYRFGSDTLAQRVTGRFNPPKLNGYQSVSDYLSRSLNYPATPREAGIQGKVVLTMKLTKDGKLNDIMVLQSADKVLDAEAARVLHFAPHWAPATLNGQPIDLCIVFPITFKLD